MEGNGIRRLSVEQVLVPRRTFSMKYKQYAPYEKGWRIPPQDQSPIPTDDLALLEQGIETVRVTTGGFVDQSDDRLLNQHLTIS